MSTLFLIGLGLTSDGLSAGALRILSSCDSVFAETYTSLIPGLDLGSVTVGKAVVIKALDRAEVEGSEIVLDALATGDVALLVPGDPMISTTHISLRIDAARKGHQSRIIHSSSVYSAAIGESCLQATHFGRLATISFHRSRQPYDVLCQNLRTGLHTLFLLDIDAEEGRYMRIKEGLESLLAVEEEVGGGAICRETLGIGLARVAQDDQRIVVAKIAQLLETEFGEPPHSIVIPGQLHFSEEEALRVLLGYEGQS